MCSICTLHSRTVLSTVRLWESVIVLSHLTVSLSGYDHNRPLTPHPWPDHCQSIHSSKLAPHSLVLLYFGNLSHHHVVESLRPADHSLCRCLYQGSLQRQSSILHWRWLWNMSRNCRVHGSDTSAYSCQYPC